MISFLRSFCSASPLRVNTAPVKDVILFKYENPKFFKYLNLFAISQLGFWTYLAEFAYSTLRDAPITDPDPDVSWWKKINLGENKYRNGIATSCALVGSLMLVGGWTYTLRSVRYLVLRKGGKSVSFVTYTPFGQNRILDVPINKISAAESRANARVSLPIKVKGKMFYYILDMKGEFKNPTLFDASAGLRRTLK